jgi:hypothetical protein
MAMTTAAIERRDVEDHVGSAFCYSNGCRRPQCRAAATAYQGDRRAFIREHGQLVPGWRQLLTTTQESR